MSLGCFLLLHVWSTPDPQLVSAQLVHTLSAKPWATIRSWTRLPYNFGTFYLTITSSLTLQL